MNYERELGECGIKRHLPSIEDAGDMVGINLKDPVDLSQMNVFEISSCPENEAFTDRIVVLRKSVLRTYVFNDDGDREELTVTFELRSQKMPKLKR